MVVLLLGLKHCGKSSLGRGAAHALGSRFFDLDEVAVELLQARGECLPQEESAKVIRRYYEQNGRDAFRTLERSAALTVVRRVNSTVGTAADPAKKSSNICALGGGTPENEAAYTLLRPLSWAIYLRERPEILFERIVAGGVPPFFEGQDPWEAFSALATRRDALYQSLSDEVFELEGQSIAVLLPKLIQRIEEYQDGR
ncbi:MAG: hypothetical protein EA428_07940 [Spirochaetaceae bacterium]|nr:MAG: hypothetical protein EA428_07940 [Spirochaetaceae bacterium]